MDKHYSAPKGEAVPCVQGGYTYAEVVAMQERKQLSVLGRGLAETMADAETDYARDSERIMTYQSDRITELEAENAELKRVLALTRDALAEALKHLRGH